MAIRRDQRTYPLSLKSTAAYALNTGLVTAYDYVGDPANAYAGGDGVPHVGTKTLPKDAGANFPVVTVEPGLLGRDISQGLTAQQAYRGMYTAEMGIGSADGRANFTVHHRYRTPSAVRLTTSGARTLASYYDAAGAKIRLLMREDTAGYFYFYWELGTVAASFIPASSERISSAALRVLPNQLIDLYLVRDGDNIYYYLNGALVATLNYPAYVIYNTLWTGGTTASQHGFTGANPADLIFIDQELWNRALSGPEITQHKNDPYAGYVNSAVVANGIFITSPAPGSTVSNEGFQFSGTYAGATPTSIQARFNGGAWTTVVSSPAGGSFVATMPAVPAGTGLLEVRYSNNTSVTNSITVTAAPPMPTVAAASQGAPDGQQVAFGVSFTRANTVRIDLVAAGNGAVNQSATIAVGYATTSATTNYTFQEVAPGDYTVVLAAINAAGETTVAGTPFSILGVGGGGSGPGEPGTITVPGAPTAVSATAENGRAIVTFTAPASTGGAEITGYRVTASTGQTVIGEASPIAISVPNGTPVSFKVAAINSAGPGADSASSNTVTPASTVPSAPRNVVATAQSGGILVSFIAPLSDGGSPITEYRVTTSLGEAMAGNSSPILVDSPDGVLATVTVRAVNSKGEGPASAPSNPVTPGSVPGAPTNVVAVPGNGFVEVSFTPPTEEGGWAVTGFRVEASSGESVEAGESPIRITVARGVPVTFTVRALNAIGASDPSAPSAAVTPRAPFVRLNLFAAGAPVVNLGNLRWAWFDQATPDTFTSPTEKGAVESTDATGELRIDLPGSALGSGAIGWLIVTNSDGNPGTAHKAFSGPVEVE